MSFYILVGAGDPLDPQGGGGLLGAFGPWGHLATLLPSAPGGCVLLKRGTSRLKLKRLLSGFLEGLPFRENYGYIFFPLRLLRAFRDGPHQQRTPIIQASCA